MTTVDHLLAIPAAPAAPDQASQRRSDGVVFAGVLSDVEHTPVGTASDHRGTSGNGEDGEPVTGGSEFHGSAAARSRSQVTAAAHPVSGAPASTSSLVGGALLLDPAADATDVDAGPAARRAVSVAALAASAEQPGAATATVSAPGRSFLAARLRSSVIAATVSAPGTTRTDAADVDLPAAVSRPSVGVVPAAPAASPARADVEAFATPIPAATTGDRRETAPTAQPAPPTHSSAVGTDTTTLPEGSIPVASDAAASTAQPTGTVEGLSTAARTASIVDAMVDPATGPLHAPASFDAVPAASTGGAPHIATSTAPAPATAHGASDVDRRPIAAEGPVRTGVGGAGARAASPYTPLRPTGIDSGAIPAADRTVAPGSVAAGAAGPQPSADSVAAIAAVVGPTTATVAPAGATTGSPTVPSHAGLDAVPLRASPGPDGTTVEPATPAAPAVGVDVAGGGRRGEGSATPAAPAVGVDVAGSSRRGEGSVTPAALAVGVDDAGAGPRGEGSVSVVVDPEVLASRGDRGQTSAASARAGSAVAAPPPEVRTSSGGEPTITATAVPDAPAPVAARVGPHGPGDAIRGGEAAAAASAPSTSTGRVPEVAAPVVGAAVDEVAPPADIDGVPGNEPVAGHRSNRPAGAAGPERPTSADDLARPDARPADPTARPLEGSSDARTVTTTARVAEQVAWREVLERIDRQRLAANGTLELEIVTERFGLLRVEAAEGRDGIHLSLRGDEANQRELADLADELRQQFGRDGAEVTDVEVGADEDGSLDGDPDALGDAEHTDDDQQLDLTTHPTDDLDTSGGLDLRL